MERTAQSLSLLQLMRVSWALPKLLRDAKRKRGNKLIFMISKMFNLGVEYHVCHDDDSFLYVSTRKTTVFILLRSEFTLTTHQYTVVFGRAKWSIKVSVFYRYLVERVRRADGAIICFSVLPGLKRRNAHTKILNSTASTKTTISLRSFSNDPCYWSQLACVENPFSESEIIFTKVGFTPGHVHPIDTWAEIQDTGWHHSLPEIMLEPIFIYFLGK